MVSLSFMFILLDWAILRTVEAYSWKGEKMNHFQQSHYIFREMMSFSMCNSLTEGSLRINWLSNS